MPTDYAKLREENIRRYGSETAHLAILGELYSERTHFIFELLQNSEDAKANYLQFHLQREELELRHDGRAFNSDDVRAICSVCESTNEGDPERIGRFGIGFKSVYAYTSRPEIHSHDEHFAIRHYVRPEPVSPRTAGDGLTTLISLPLSTVQVKAETACSEISRAFGRLDLTALLFLRHVQRVELLVDGAPAVEFSRKLTAQPTPSVRIVSLASSKPRTPEQRWLVFERPCNLTTPAGRLVSARVEVAFALTPESSETKLVIVNRDRATLAVFFPTDKPTATGMILQGPYRTTPARDNILADDNTNRRLAHETGQLLVSSLCWLRDQGALTAGVLNTLPLKRAEFPDGSLLRPVFDLVLTAIKEESLIPAYAPTPTAIKFVAGNKAKVASSGELRDLLSPELLRQVAAAETECCWLSDGLSVRGGADLACYLRKEVGVREITAGDFVSWLEKQDAPWWKSLDEGWLTRAYRYLQKQTGEHKRLRKLPIIRLESGEHVSPDAQAVFFPSDNIHEKTELAPFLPQLPIIRQSLLHDDVDKSVENLLRQLGVARLVATEFIDRYFIPRYAKSNSTTVDEDLALGRYLFRAFKRMADEDRKSVTQKLSKLEWVLCTKAEQPDSLFLLAPTDAYLGKVFTGSSSLETFCSGRPSTCFVAARYRRGKENWLDFWEPLGCPTAPHFSEDGHELDGLENALSRLASLSKMDGMALSNAILEVVSGCLPDEEGRRESVLHVSVRVYGPRGGFYGHRQVEARFLERLKQADWMPDSSGKLQRPDALFVDNEPNRRLLGDGVGYLHKSISLESEKRQWLATELGVHRRATKEAVLERLRGMKTRKTSVKQVLPLYEFLAQTGAEVGDDFEEEELILCPDAEMRWRGPSQVFWEDESPVFGATRGYLKKHYPKLYDFFTGAGVPQSAGPTDYVEALLELAKAAITDQPNQTRVHRICKRLSPRLEEGGEWLSEEAWETCWTELQSGRNWLGRKANGVGFFHLSELVRVDNEHIAELFHDGLAFWPFPDLNSFASELLEIAPVSSAQCRFKVAGEQQVLPRLADGLSESWNLIAAFLRSEKWLAGVREGAEAAMRKAPTVRLAHRIAVTYELNGAIAEEPGGKDGFLDTERAVIWLTQKSDEDDLIEALGDALQEFFGPEVLREFVCDLFRKGPKKAVEKWRKKGLILSQPPTEDHPGEETEQEGPAAKGEESTLGNDAPEATGLGADREQVPPATSGQSGVPEPTPVGQPEADRSATARSGAAGPPPPSAGTKPPQGIPAANLETQDSTKTGADSSHGAFSQGTSKPIAPQKNEAQPQEESPPASASAGPAKGIKEALHDAFNKPGKTGISDDRPESGSVGNPKERRKRTRENYEARKSREPAASHRVTQRVIDVWDPKNKAIRDFLYEEYSGRCQICGETNRFPRRDGRAYFEAVYLIPHSQAAWTDDPGSVVCLCALCSAKFQYGAVRCENVAAQIHAQKAIAEGGHGKPMVTIELVGKQVNITFSERHLIDVQEMLRLGEATGAFTAAGQQVQVGLVKCPHCQATAPLVRADRLAKHIRKVHGAPRPIIEPKSRS